jgi:hypothetical protein
MTRPVRDLEEDAAGSGVANDSLEEATQAVSIRRSRLARARRVYLSTD